LKFEKSRELYERAKKSHAGGVGSSSRAPEKPHPLFFERAKGSKMYDVDGNEFIDYWLGYGPAIFGHAPDFLVDAVAASLQDGQAIAGQHEMEIKVSELIQRIVPCAELVRYANSGTEADQAAIRLARGHTGKNKFIKFEGHFHGWADSISYSHHPTLEEAGPRESPTPIPDAGGIGRGTADEVIILPWNDIDILRDTIERRGDEIAAILTESIMCNTNHIFPRPGYLEEMRRLCDEYEIVLIFDEVITGFRVALGGAQELLGVTPDLATFGKAMAGGFAISMVAGKRDIMSQLEAGTVFHGGTLNSNMTSMAAVNAAINKLMEDDGAIHKQLYATGAKLMEGLRRLGTKHEQPMLIQGPGPTFYLSFTEAEEITDYRSHVENVDEEKYQRFRLGMLERGVRLIPRGQWYVSAAHTDEDIEKTLAVADEVLATL
jgi:glutamate-1-semialdehyde 2,1-aminomutase